VYLTVCIISCHISAGLASLVIINFSQICCTNTRFHHCALIGCVSSINSFSHTVHKYALPSNERQFCCTSTCIYLYIALLLAVVYNNAESSLGFNSAANSTDKSQPFEIKTEDGTEHNDKQYPRTCAGQFDSCRLQLQPLNISWTTVTEPALAASLAADQLQTRQTLLPRYFFPTARLPRWFDQPIQSVSLAAIIHTEASVSFAAQLGHCCSSFLCCCSETLELSSTELSNCFIR